MRRAVILSAGLFLIVAMALLVAFNFQKPRILVLQSYDSSYPWTRDVDAGLKRVLGRQIEYSIRWHYMDTKRHPGQDYRIKAGGSARHTIDHWKPDVLIAIDDDAQALVARQYVGRPDIFIVFAGVNGEIRPYGYEGASNVAGILERKPLRALRETLQQIAEANGLPAHLRFVHIGDTSESVRLDEEGMEAFDWAPLVRLDSRLVKNFQEWKEAVAAAQSQADVIITTNYRRLSRSAEDKALMQPHEVVAWTEANSRVPVVGTNGFYVEEGGALAIGASGFEQGEVAARLALDRLAGRLRTGAQQVISPRHFVVFVRAKDLARKSLHIPSLHEAFARALGTYIE